MKNLLDAISGLLCLLYSQIGEGVQHIFKSNIYFSSNDPDVSVRSFKIIPSRIADDEKYDFNWEELKNEADRFQQFQYI